MTTHAAVRNSATSRAELILRFLSLNYAMKPIRITPRLLYLFAWFFFGDDRLILGDDRLQPWRMQCSRLNFCQNIAGFIIRNGLQHLVNANTYDGKKPE